MVALKFNWQLEVLSKSNKVNDIKHKPMIIEIIINKQYCNHADKKAVQSRKGEEAAGNKDIIWQQCEKKESGQMEQQQFYHREVGKGRR